MKKDELLDLPETGRSGNPGRKKTALLTAMKQPKKERLEVGSAFPVRAPGKQPGWHAGKVGQKPATRMERFASFKRSELRNGLTDRQRRFILEKIAGLNDKDAELAAGYSLSVAENTKQRVWKKRLHVEYFRVQQNLARVPKTPARMGPQIRIIGQFLSVPKWTVTSLSGLMTGTYFSFRHVISTRTGISFFTAIVRSVGGSILKSDSAAGIVPEIFVSFPFFVCSKATCL